MSVGLTEGETAIFSELRESELGHAPLTLTIPSESSAEELPSELPVIGHTRGKDGMVTWKTHESLSSGLGNRPRSHRDAAHDLGQAAPGGLPGEGQELGIFNGGNISETVHKTSGMKKEHQITNGKETTKVEGKQSNLDTHWLILAMQQAQEAQAEHEKQTQDSANIDRSQASITQRLTSSVQTGLNNFILNNN